MKAYHRRNKRYQHCARVSRPFNFLNQRPNVSFGKLALINARGEVAVGTTRTTKRNVNIQASVSHLMSNDNNTHVYYFTFRPCTVFRAESPANTRFFLISQLARMLNNFLSPNIEIMGGIDTDGT